MRISIVLILWSVIYTSHIFADTTQTPKRALLYNSSLIYNKMPQKATTLQEFFSLSEVYGRIRSNNIYFGYDHEDPKHQSNYALSIGTSFIYKTASLYNIDATLGIYASQAFFDPDFFGGNIALMKSPKDTFSRYDYIQTGSKTLMSFAQANLRYTFPLGSITIGRQLVDTFYTKSSDSKMVPNSFEGISSILNTPKNTTLFFAYLTQQKLKNQENFHAPFMYDDSDVANYSFWNGNDDTAMHKGISYTNLVANGKKTDAPLLVAQLQTHATRKFQLRAASYLIPSLLGQIMGEANYHFALTPTTQVIPGIRLVHQFDKGAGIVGGASLKGDVSVNNPAGYTHPDSLDGGMIALRVLIKTDQYKLNLAYTNILDKADLVTPWRGFVTAGYTRSMGVYNWRANTRSYRIEFIKDTNKNGIYVDPFIQTSILYINTDENKNIFEDSIVYYFGIVQNFPSFPQMQYRIRLGYRDFIGKANFVSNYADTRFELNYLF